MPPLVLKPCRGESEAERKFADACQELSDAWTVAFGVYWNQPSRGGLPEREGEIDAVISHPALGFLAVEVKGGAIRRTSRGWISRDRFGHDHVLDPGPIDQAQHARNRLMGMSRRTYAELGPSTPGNWVQRPLITWAVAFPDLPSSTGLEGEDLPADRILHAGHAQAIESSLRSVLTIPSDFRQRDPLPPTAYRRLWEHLVPGQDRERESDFDSMRELMESSTLPAEHLWENLCEIRRLRVRGVPGSGKTGLLRALCRDALSRGERPLYLSLSQPLALRMSNRLGPYADCRTLDELCAEAARRAGSALTDPVSDGPDLLRRALDAGDLQPWSTVAIDEAQSIPTPWWPVLERFTKPDGRLWIAHDPLQDIEGVAPELPPLPEAVLPRSVRCTRAIVEWLSKESGFDLMPDAHAPFGNPVQVHDWKRPEEIANGVSGTIEHWVSSGIRPEDILVVSLADEMRSVLARWDSPWWSPSSTGRDLPPGAIPLLSVKAALSHETLAVVVVDVPVALDEATARKLVLAGSRAEVMLSVHRTRS